MPETHHFVQDALRHQLPVRDVRRLVVDGRTVGGGGDGGRRKRGDGIRRTRVRLDRTCRRHRARPHGGHEHPHREQRAAGAPQAHHVAVRLGREGVGLDVELRRQFAGEIGHLAGGGLAEDLLGRSLPVEQDAGVG